MLTRMVVDVRVIPTVYTGKSPLGESLLPTAGKPVTPLFLDVVSDFANSNEILRAAIVSLTWRTPGQESVDSPPLMRSDNRCRGFAASTDRRLATRQRRPHRPHRETYIAETNRIIDKERTRPAPSGRARTPPSTPTTPGGRAAQHGQRTGRIRSRSQHDTGPAPSPGPQAGLPYPPLRQRPDGVCSAFEDDQFEAILKALAAHRNAVERTAGAGAVPEVSKERHRDQVLGVGRPTSASWSTVTASSMPRQ